MYRILIHIPRDEFITIRDFPGNIIEPRCDLSREMIPYWIINNDAVESVTQDACKPVATSIQEQITDVSIPVVFCKPPDEIQNRFLFQILITSLLVKYRALHNRLTTASVAR